MKEINTYTLRSLTKRLLSAVAIVTCTTLLFSCNKDFENKLSPSTKNDTLGISAKKRKVLYIIVDGARGKAVRALETPNLTKIAKNSIYAYDALSDYEEQPMTNASGWSTMLTGVGPDKHNVLSEDFSGDRLDQYPSMITRLKQADAKLRTAVFGASKIFTDKLAKDATLSETAAGNDGAVKAAVSKELLNDDASIIVAQFHDVEVAGKTYGYSETATGYAAAITKMDSYIGEILTDLRARKNFAQENWLVVLASSKGGELPVDPDQADVTAYGDGARNNFIFFYNPRFNTQVVPKPATDQIPYTGSAPVFYGQDAENMKAIIPNDEGLYNFGTRDFTVQFKFKSSGVARSWPVFLSKSEKINNPNAGWLFYISGNNYSMNVSGNNYWHNFSSNSVVNDGKWHTITAVFYTTAGKRYVRCMTDGVTTNTVEVTYAGVTDNTQPLTIGRHSGDAANPDVMLTELQIYNTALPEDHVKAYFRKTSVNAAHPYYGNLVGYWPLNEGSGNTIVNRAPLPAARNKNFTLTGIYQWQNYNDVSPVLNPDISPDFYKVVPNSVDIPVEIYHWMGISISDKWYLDGKTWTPVYSDVKP